MQQFGKFCIERCKKTKKPPLPLLKNQEQKLDVGSKSIVLNMPPALNTTKEERKTPKTALPSCHRRKKFTTPQ